MEEQQQNQEQEQVQEQAQGGRKKPNLSVVWLTLGVVGMIWMFQFIFGLMYPEDREKTYYNAELTSLTPAELCSEQGVKILEKTVGKPLYFFLLSMEADSNNQLYSVRGWLFSQDQDGNFQDYDLVSVGEHHVEGMEPYQKTDTPTSLVRKPGVSDCSPDWHDPEDWVPVSILAQLNPGNSPLEQLKNEQPIPPSHNYVITLGKNEGMKSFNREDIRVNGSGELVTTERGAELALSGRFIRLDGSSFDVTAPEQLSRRMIRVYLQEEQEGSPEYREMWMLERD